MAGLTDARHGCHARQGLATHRGQDRALTEAIVQLASQMGMRTIAEGVERLEQQRFLEGIGADPAQGFLYLRPTAPTTSAPGRTLAS